MNQHEYPSSANAVPSGLWPSGSTPVAPPVEHPPFAAMLKELSSQVDHLCNLLSIQEKAHENGASPLPPGVSVILQDYSRAAERMASKLTAIIREVESIRREIGI